MYYPYMAELSRYELEQILAYRRLGYTYKDISGIYGISRQNICNKLSKAFGKKRELKEVYFNESAETELGEFIGFFMGDGHFEHTVGSAYKTSLYFGPEEKEYASYMSGISSKVFGKELRRWKTGLNYIHLVVCGKEIYEIIRRYVSYGENKTHTVKLADNPKNHSIKCLKGIIRGLIASDGTVNIPYKRISFSSTSKELVYQTAEALKIFDINSNIYYSNQKHYSTLYTLVISRRENLIKFSEKIGLTEPLKCSKLTKALNSYKKSCRNISPSSLAA